MSTDRIEKTILLRASRARVWRALAKAEEFGDWFGVALEGTFAPGARLTGRFTSHDDKPVIMTIMVERMEPEKLLSYRWHPQAIETGAASADEPATLVEFHIADHAEGTHLTVVESGFDRLPPAYRATSFRRNEQGWAEQLTNIAHYVAT